MTHLGTLEIWPPIPQSLLLSRLVAGMERNEKMRVAAERERALQLEVMTRILLDAQDLEGAYHRAGFEANEAEKNLAGAKAELEAHEETRPASPAVAYEWVTRLEELRARFRSFAGLAGEAIAEQDRAGEALIEHIKVRLLAEVDARRAEYQEINNEMKSRLETAGSALARTHNLYQRFDRKGAQFFDKLLGE